MRQPRLKAPPGPQPAYYHCLSRVVERRHHFGEAEKEQFVALMQEYAEFCEVRVLTYCILDNHFHLLLEVPPPPETLPTADQIVEKLGRLSGHQDVERVRQRLAQFRQAEDAEGEAAYLAGFHARMWDLSAFMKQLKQRFSQWFNGRHERKGTLWEERFRSVLVEGAGMALATMAAYIDLNPVRAGVVEDPKEYRWSGYGEAVAGRKGAKLGIQRLVRGLQRGKEEELSRSLEVYRMYLYLEGDERREGVGEDGRPTRGVLKAEEVAAVLRAKGRLPVREYVRCRVRYFCDGAVFGSREFVEGVFRGMRERFGPRRKSGARAMRGLEAEEGAGLYTVRDFRRNGFG
jgi:putative transposase